MVLATAGAAGAAPGQQLERRRESSREVDHLPHDANVGLSAEVALATAAKGLPRDMVLDTVPEGTPSPREPAAASERHIGSAAGGTVSPRRKAVKPSRPLPEPPVQVFQDLRNLLISGVA